VRTVKLIAVLGLVAFGAVLVPAARADQISICQSTVACPGSDPNVITNSSSFIAFVNGSATLQSPLLVIVGVYNGVGTPTITFPGVTPAVVGTYGLTANTGTLTSGGDAFTQLGLSSGGSESFTNWSAGDVANGIAAPTSFSLYAFALPTALTSSGITLGESGAAKGSYIIAFDCKTGTGTNTVPGGAVGGCSTQGDVAQTVFTNTGLFDSPPTTTPEPSTSMLLGFGLLGLVGLRRKQIFG